MHSNTANRRFRLLLSYSILLFVIILIIYPLLWAVGASFNPGNSLMSMKVIPDNASLIHYKQLFKNEISMEYITWYKNSIKISLWTMILSLCFVSVTAYVFSRFRFRGRKNGLMLFLLLQMIPQFSALIAIFVLARMLNLINSHFLLILIYVGGQIPMNTYLMKGYFDTIPRDLDESAKMDGASPMRIFWKILLPLARPMLAVVAMNGFTGPLGDFALSSVLLRSSEYYTLPIGLYQLITDKMGASYTTFAAGAILISIPISLVFLLLQKNFVTGLTAGGTKG
ncbi:sugar ABC transporter permease [Aerococcaceae bacterium zg-BR9]|uniref:sugar ABC transporter permease n=1 Tax=Aerococcaceae bacterium zg-1292 TaxID=2774330 RepID=UPI0040631F03|nr:sugar ABC transporter permease [Aerococcaceae bacterium zg-BR9]MBF6977582.1 sugar ABC transporter permease [Aerococcaceae bacterium zg-BR22]